MANRYLVQFFYTFFKKPVLIAGKLPLSASAAVGSYAIKGVTSIAKSGTGLYTLTLEDKYYSYESLQANVQGTTADVAVNFGAVSLSNKTIVIQTKVAGVLADVSAACEIQLSLLFNDSSAK